MPLWMACIFAVMLAACTPASTPLPEIPQPAPTPAPAITFPRDALPHDSLTEWWYYTGHLTAEDGRQFGFEFVVFQVARANQPTGYLSHFAISDVGAQRFSHQARFAQAPAPATAFPLDVNGWRLDHREGLDSFEAAMQPGPGADAAYALRLQLEDTSKPPALHHGGYITYQPAGGSYYYSRTRLNASGSLTLADGSALSVSGIAWMDHQWGNFVIGARGGWDWYSLQLDDATELMLYILRNPDGSTSSVYGSYVRADGGVDDVSADAVVAESTGTWMSPHTGAEYPSGWLLTLADGRRLVLTPQLQDQELYFPQMQGAPLAYWEGSVAVTGDATGLGYVELTGYATRS